MTRAEPAAPPTPPERRDSAPPRLRVAYLVNQYPHTSHSFIRREIAALEASGVEVVRFSVRRPADALVDPGDRAEQARTTVLLDAGKGRLLAEAARRLVTDPRAWLRGVRAAWGMGRRSDRGVVVHLVYFAEACALRRLLRANGVRHLHAHFGTNPAAVALLCSEVGGPGFSFTVHGPEEFDRPEGLSLGEKVRRARFVAAVSEFGRSQIYRWVPRSEWSRVHVVRCGLDADFLAGPVTPVPESRRLVCVGRLAEQKGHFTLIEAAARIRSAGERFELVLVGDGPLREEIAAGVAERGLGDCVRLAGWRSNEGVRDELRRSRALVVPSYAEGLPVVIMEALALGRPVVATTVAGIPELVRDGESGWLAPPGSVGALSEAISDTLAAPVERLERMGRAGAARVAERHDAAAEAARLAELFREAASEFVP